MTGRKTMNKINMAEMYSDDEIKNKAVSILDSGKYIKGEENQKFEEEFARFCGSNSAVIVNSGTNALILALKSLGIGPGDEVIVPSHTFIATANAVLFIGAKPVFADINPENYTISPDDIRSKVNKATKAVIPVHIYGHPCDMDEICEIAEENGLCVIEDACQSHGAEYKGRKTGSIGDIAAFSFFPSKNMTVSGDGGAITIRDPEVAEIAAAIRDQGRRDGSKYFHEFPGLNLRLSEIHAAIGRIQLRHLPEWNMKRRENAAFFSSELDVDGIVVPKEESWAKGVYHQYVIRIKDREGLQKHLSGKGIATGIHYPIPVHMQPVMAPYAKGAALPVTEGIADEILSIPVHPFLSSAEREYIAESITEYFR